MSEQKAPIVIKRVKKVAGGHHGGAWKIAYADFVTAMMAFFLLMWLLGSTAKGDLQGIAEYFKTPLKVAMLGGSGSGDSSSVIRGGGQDLTRTTGQVKRGDIQARRDTINLHQLKAEQIRAEVARLQTLKAQVQARIDANPRLAGVRRQLRLDMTPDGLRIQIMDADGRPMFASGSAVVEPEMHELLRDIGGVLATVPNRLTLEGHTDSMPYPGNDRGYSNWELSADRANASRRELLAGGLPDDRVLRVQGLAAANPFDRLDPAAPANRRISIVVMTREAEERVFSATPANGPDAEDAAAPSIVPPRPQLVPQAGSSPDAAHR